MSEEVNPSLSIAFDLAMKRYSEEQKRTDVLNRRSNLLIGYAGGLGALYYGVTVPYLSEDIFNIGGIYTLVSMLFILVIEVSVIFLCLRASNSFLLNNYATGPGGNVLLVSSDRMSGDVLKKKILSVYTRAYDWNYQLNLKASALLKKAVGLTVLGLVLGFLFFTIQVSIRFFY